MVQDTQALKIARSALSRAKASEVAERLRTEALRAEAAAQRAMTAEALRNEAEARQTYAGLLAQNRQRAVERTRTVARTAIAFSPRVTSPRVFSQSRRRHNSQGF